MHTSPGLEVFGDGLVAKVGGLLILANSLARGGLLLLTGLDGGGEGAAAVVADPLRAWRTET